MKPIGDWKDAYDPQIFADKYGITLQQARAVISSNGPSRHGCDVGAIAFIRALAMRDGRQPSRHRSKA
ncbi:hypothetical protein EN788_12260 [Mesorhizobium sp. M2D.F.Ca.ET.145.01.1.1]|nr:hypothetical protein EN873_09785 [bacterium M00.F.Ca.ET.230.01.1.1]TGV70813.1 hypothetical protein EN803_10340 [Mesorhizobium sp. M2D.F.Ca.ET.160.01.1.1]TGV77310.1 hypothetical protein EN792_049500 [Mesorhizobium sp. M00.F.Ca.ET.149.01.1.1]TGW12418.1 hypothetical protein EN788_12260 [Mesorhizobium sp. M2D.F.Ca.ET.145.01.1.1]